MKWSGPSYKPAKPREDRTANVRRCNTNGINRGDGGRTWARTKDPLIKSQLLYQLSYASIPNWPEQRSGRAEALSRFA